MVLPIATTLYSHFPNFDKNLEDSGYYAKISYLLSPEYTAATPAIRASKLAITIFLANLTYSPSVHI